MKCMILLMAISLLCSAPGSMAEEVASQQLQASVASPPDPKGATIQLRFTDLGNRTLAVTEALRPVVSGLKPGDGLDVTLDDIKNPKSLTSASITTRDVSLGSAFAAVLVSGVALLLVGWLFMQSNPLQLIVGEDGRYSKSKLQMGAWFLAIFSVYLGTVVMRALYLGDSFIGGVNIPSNLMILSGLSAFSFGAAKAVTTQKTDNASAKNNAAANLQLNAGQPQGQVQDANAANAANPAPQPAAAPTLLLPTKQTGTAHFSDLFQNDVNKFDLGDAQMMLITLVVIAMFIITGVCGLQRLPMISVTTLPDVDTTLLSLFGLGQGAYLFKKAASQPGSG